MSDRQFWIGFALGSILTGLVCAYFTIDWFMAAVGTVSAINSLIGLVCFRTTRQESLVPQQSIALGYLNGSISPLSITALGFLSQAAQ